MCGINGIFNLKREGHWGEKVGRMNNALAHRGPDDEGLYEEPGLALGHRRLSIIDLSAAGHQPMHFDNGRYTIVYNGELYNYRELRDELKEISFRTNSDTEVILAAYAKWGRDCLKRFNGMWGMAIWDKQKQTLFIARDRLGIKPVYYTIDKDTCAFSSEIRSLLESGIAARKLNKDALEEYLTYQTVYAPVTLVKKINMLPPGCCMLLDATKKPVVIDDAYRETPPDSPVKMWMYWDIGDVFASEEESYEVHKTQVRKLLRDAVERRLVADVPFGAFLSGGIDSSAIVGLMSEVSSLPVKTFSVTFDESEFSEAKYARLVADKFKTDHHEIRLKPEDFLRVLPDALAAMDHPSGDGPNTWLISKVTREAGITMALSGLGSDELFAGYPVFKRAFRIRGKKWVNYIPSPLRKLTGKTLRAVKPGVASDKIAALLGLNKFDFNFAYPLVRRGLLDDQLIKLTGNKLDDYDMYVRDPFADRDLPFDRKQFLITQVSLLEMSSYMQNVLLRDTDQMSMAHALEVRVPFLDYKLVQYVLDLPDKFKYPHTPKKLLVDALGDLLPPEIVNRPKMGFVFPWKHWMKKELRGFCEERLNWLGENGVLKKEGVQELWNQFLADDPRVTWSRIWPMVVLSDWMQRNRIEP
ncbi:MAG: asparagine synthase [Bacteroidetes bacterium]|nr:MAG: asparagine synthase [Bacteroidota bacterium]